MHKAQVPTKPGVGEGTRGDELETLRSDISKLKADADNKWKRMVSVVGVIGGLLGFVSTLIAFPKAIRDTRNEWFSRATISIHAEDVTIRYEPGDATFTVQFPALLINDGSADDIIRGTEGELVYYIDSDRKPADDHNSEVFNAGSGEFTFYSKGTPDALSVADQIPLPIEIGKGTGRPLMCSILFDKGTFTKAGENRLNIRFSSETGPPKLVSFCFYLDTEEIRELQETRESGKKRFIHPTCGV